MIQKFLQMDGRQRVRFVAMRGGMSIVGTFAAITLMVSASADEALAPLSWFAEVKYTDTFWHMNGDVGITGLDIRPMSGDVSENISVERITVHTPGFFWLARAATAKRKESWPGEDGGVLEPSLPAMDRVGVSVEGLRFSAETYFPEQLSWVGVDSAAPFEAAGCGDEDFFDNTELTMMGLPGSRQRFTFMVEAVSYDVIKWSGELVSPEVSTIRIERSERVPNAERYVTLLAEGIPEGTGKHIDTKIRVEDAGFVAKRNAECAKRLEITEQEFVERHLAAVKRLALVHGAVPPDDFTAAYRDYATNGGVLEIVSRPMTSIPEEQWGEFSPEDQFKLHNVSFVRGEKEVPLAMTFVEPKPLPADPTSLAAIEGEVAAEIARELEIERQLALGNAKARGAEARARRAPVAVAVAAPTAPPVPKIRSGQEIEFEQLREYVGRKVKINTAQMIGKLATVEKYTDATVTLRVHFVGGSATYEFTRENLRRIVVM